MTDDRLKIWIDLGKWFIVSVGLVVMTKIIDTGFKDREVGINEIKEYDKYVELVTDYNKIAERRLLAQYFAYVTPSEKLREGWLSYYESVDEEYNQTLQKVENKKVELDMVVQSDTANNNVVTALKSEIEKLNNELTPTFNSRNKHESALVWEALGFKYLIDKNLDNAIQAFEKSENSYNTFHQVYEIARFLKSEKSKVSSESDIDWGIIYKTVLNKYSWKMPEDAKKKLEQLIL